MKTIHKATLNKSTEPAYINMPAGAEILSVGSQLGDVVVHYLCDTDEPTEVRVFQSLMTGAPINSSSNFKYLGTVHLSGGHFILHVVEILPVDE